MRRAHPFSLNMSLVGKRFNKLVVLETTVERDYTGCIIWLVKCDCGELLKLPTSKLTRSKNSQKSCGCLLRPYAKQNKTALRTVFLNYRNNAKYRDLEFNLTMEQVESLINSKCYYCDSQAIGIDRVDNDKGYSLDNIVPCCRICNRAKMHSSKEEFISWIKCLVKKWSTE